ncbi:MAG: YcaO-like family protein [Syntrophales bacterium]|nr:YcaO-like family protein [Syntrophales bacterium]
MQTEITLKHCQKVYILETHRSKSPADTLQFIEGMKNILGMQLFTDATDIDRIGLPVFTCKRIRPDNSPTWHTGKGFTKIQAQVSLTMEAIERYCSEFRNGHSELLVRGSYNGLKGAYTVLDPASLILPQFNTYTSDDVCYWVWGYDLISKESILVPACAVFHPFHLDEKPLMNTHTDGFAAGNTIEEAVFHALMEVIERDAWSIAKFNNRPGEALIIDDVPENGFLIDIMERYNQADVEIIARDITSDIGVPVIAAFSRDLIHETMMPIDGFGAHLDPKVAMSRALTEVATTRALFIQKHGISGLCESLPRHIAYSEGEDPRFSLDDEKSLQDLDIGFSQDILSDIEQVITMIKNAGLDRVIVVDLTRPEVGMPTVRVIVPGAETYCFDKSRRGERLY